MNDDENLFLKHITDLHIRANDFPRGFDYQMLTLDENISDELEKINQHTLKLLQDLANFVLANESQYGDKETSSVFSLSDDQASPISIFAASENANQILLNDLESLSDSFSTPNITTPSSERHNIESYYETTQIGDLEFIFSKTVPKPPKFVTPNTQYLNIPSDILMNRIQNLPILVNTTPPTFDYNKMIKISTVPQEESSINQIIGSFPHGPLFIDCHNHRVRTYRPYCSLLLVMTPQYQVYVFDLLQIRSDLSHLFNLLMNENIQKIMYNAEENLQILSESHNIYISPLIDLALIEYPLNSSAKPPLFEDLIGLKFRKCIVDWRIRPLNEELLTIASQSVWYLPSLAYTIFQRNNNILDVLNNPDNSWYSENRRTNYPFKFTNELAISIAQEIIDLDENPESLNEDDRNTILELVKWRNTVAALEEESPNFIATNLSLLIITKERPDTANKLIECLGNIATPHLTTYASDLVLIVKKDELHLDESNVLKMLQKT